MDIDSIQRLITQRRDDIGQRYASLPQTEANIRASLFGGDKTLGSLRENAAAKIKELYTHDKQMASTFQSTAPDFIEDPGARASYGRQVLANTGGELADIQKGVANRQDVLGEALKNAMNIAKTALEAKRLELESLQEERRFALDREKAKSSGSGSGSGGLQDLFAAIM